MSSQAKEVSPGQSNSVQNNDRSTIFVTGEVNSGKSSFINAIVGGIVSNVSIQRETFNPIWYQFSDTGTETNLRKISEGLEAVHTQNVGQRKSLADLKEEDVSTFLKITDDNNELPVRFGLLPFNLVDCPGINDAADDKQLFLSALKNRVSAADLIIYVTDAKKAFTQASEITEFKKIQQLVDEEKSTGHYVDIIIVVNKFDSLDNTDLREIFDGIFQALPNFSRDKVFRFSSHKMLLDNVLRCKLDLFVPLFSRPEIQHVLKNCNAQLTSAVKRSMKRDNILHHSDIVIEQDISDQWSDEEDENECTNGEADHEVPGTAPLVLLRTDPYFALITCLREFQSRLTEQRVQVAKTHLLAKCSDLQKQCASHNDASTQLQSVMKLLSRFDDLGATDVYESCMLSEMNQLGKVHKPYWNRYDRYHRAGDALKVLLVFMWQQARSSGQKAIVQHMQRHTDDYSIDIHHVFAHLFLSAPKTRDVAVKWSYRYCEWLKHFGLHSPTFTSTEWRFFEKPDPTCRSVICKRVGDGETSGTHDNPVINNLLNSPFVPPQVRMLLKLAVTPLTYLEEMDRSQQLPYELLESFEPGMMRYLRLLMSTLTPQERALPLLHKFFAMQSSWPSLTPHAKFIQEWTSITVMDKISLNQL